MGSCLPGPVPLYVHGICPYVSVNPVRSWVYHSTQLLIPVCSLGSICCLYPVTLLSEGKVCKLCSSHSSSTRIFTAFPATTLVSKHYSPPNRVCCHSHFPVEGSPNPSYPLLPLSAHVYICFSDANQQRTPIVRSHTFLDSHIL